METEKKFNLVDEPWILVLDDLGKLRQVSLVELFEHAHEFKCLAGELPTQDIAVMRVLLAIVCDVFTQVDVEGEGIVLENVDNALRQWKSLWDQTSFPCDQVKKYLEYYRERFYLIHPETPFFQVSGLRTSNDECNSISQIIADVPSRSERRFFSNRTGTSVSVLPYDEAARWLIHLQSWDYAGKKASIIGGNPNGGGTGWLGKLGVIYLEGRNIFETLLLNFVLADNNGLIEFGAPSWREPCTIPGKRDRPPHGYVELLTWQSRRVLLFEENGCVTGALSSYGDVFEKDNTFIEQMSGWHRSTGGKGSTPTFIPNLVKKERLLWRDLTSLLPSQSSTDNNRAPGTVMWRGVLKQKGLLSDDSAQIVTIGIEYGSMMGVVNELVTDRLTIHAGFFSSLNEEWIPLIGDALDCTEGGVNGLGTLARDLEKAAGADDQSPSLAKASKSAREIAYGTLDEPFRKWLANINPEQDDPDELCVIWKRNARVMIEKIGEDLVARSSAKTMAGRGKGRDAPSAFLKFRKTVAKSMPW